MAVKIKNAGSARSKLAEASRAMDAAARQAANQGARKAAQVARKATSEVYNLTERTLADYISIRQATVSQSFARVRLRIKAVPLSAFGARIKMQRFRFTDSLGRNVNRLLPTVHLKLYRAGGVKHFRSLFPLRQRSDGPLYEADRIKRRIGKERLKLTVPRYFTFPKRILNETVLPRIIAEVPDVLVTKFGAAFRKLFKGQRQLRGNS